MLPLRTIVRSWSAILLTGCLLPGLAVAQSGNGTPPFKQVAAPPSDILSGIVRMPERSPVSSRAALLPLAWTASQEHGGWTAQASVPATARGARVVAFVGPDAERWTKHVAGGALPPTEAGALVAAGLAERSFAPLDDHAPGWTVESFRLPASLDATLRVELFSPTRPSASFLALGDEERLTLSSTVRGWRRTNDRDLAVEARLDETGAARVETATLFVEGQAGTAAVALLDDGFGADEEAGDGTFAAWLPRGLDGTLFARVELRGQTAGGADFVRTNEHVISVLAPRARIGTTPIEVTRIDAGTLSVGIPVERSGTRAGAAGDKLLLAFEVWAEGPEGWRPLVWLSRMANVGTAQTVPFALDARWLSRAMHANERADGFQRLELRNLRLQDPDTSVVLDARASLELKGTALTAFATSAKRLVAGNLEQNLLERPVLDAAASRTTVATSLGTRSLAGGRRTLPENPALMLVHGYCAGGSPWPNADFSAPKRAFNDPNQNRSHDAFAQLLAAFAADQGLDSFGVVAHSQGGAAALHLRTYYASPLDLSVGERRIQSVGTPYQGTPLASLGFFACGVNNDLTTGGAPAWLAGIPSWARAEVHYWTTANDGAVCEFFTNLVLGNPNDGTTERSRGQLPGANNRGHVTGWCHTTGMSDPPQYRDASRNAEMDALAAR